MIGLFGVGLEAYWSQFPGMKKDIEQNYNKLIKKFNSDNIVSAGIVDSNNTAINANKLFRGNNVNCIFCYCATYSISSNLIKAVKDLNVPVILLNLQPVSSLDFNKVKDIKDWLSTCTCACIPEMTAVLIRNNISFDIITGTLHNDSTVDRQIKQWCLASAIKNEISQATIGLVGYPYEGMMDLCIDETNLFKKLNISTSFLDIELINQYILKVSKEEINYYVEIIKEKFSYKDNIIDKDMLYKASKITAAINNICKDKAISAIAFHQGIINDVYKDIISCSNLAFSILTSLGIPCCVEGDIKSSISMLILKKLSGACSLIELYSMDFDDDACIFGHSGAGDWNLSRQKPLLKTSNVFHGKKGGGFLTQFFLEKGPVTLLSLTQDSKCDFKFITAVGDCINGPILNLGDTNGRIQFTLSVRNFVNRWSSYGPTHHGAITCGNNKEVLKKLSNLMKIDLKEVC